MCLGCREEKGPGPAFKELPEGLNLGSVYPLEVKECLHGTHKPLHLHPKFYVHFLRGGVSCLLSSSSYRNP